MIFYVVLCYVLCCVLYVVLFCVIARACTSYARHVMFNEGIDCRGFAGDTMHMARLWDTSLDKMAGAGQCACSDGYRTC